MKIDNHLEERSKLDFHFYNGKHDQIHKTLTFAENVQVRESSASRLATYNPVGRNGSVFIHTGSESRKFQVTFNLTLPHIMEYTSLTPDGLSPLERFKKKKEQKDAYVNNALDGSGNAAVIPEKEMNDYVRAVDMMFEGYLDTMETIANILSQSGGGFFSFLGSGDDLRVKSIAQVLIWLNLIRSSALTHSAKPHYGPPLIRLTHGIMYQNVPCIAQNYDIQIDGQAGYDNKTLLPRVIKVSLNLVEARLTRREPFSPIGKTRDSYDAEIGWDTHTDGFISYNRVTDDSIQTSSIP